MMTFGGMSPIEYKINSLADVNSQEEYIVIIGASNSLMKNGWAFHFSRIFSGNRIINLSLGATCSSYIAFVFLMFRDILDGAKYVIVEPFVNDVSFFGNGDISIQTLSTCMDYYYGSGIGLSDKTIILLLPTRKRIFDIEFNPVYRAHVQMARRSNAKLLDCHPFFSTLSEDNLDKAFDDPAHLNSDYAFEIANWVVSYINNQPSYRISSDFEFSRKSDIFYIDVSDSESSIFRSNSLFASKLMKLEKKTFIDISPDLSLLGILHWSEFHENCFRISSCGNVQQGSLKSKYLKLTSFPFNIRGPFVFGNESEHPVGLGGFLLSNNTLSDFCCNEEYLDDDKKHFDRFHKVLLE
ncbi:SGNH/GDSL hydrolase family protein [Comamonas sp. lk]|uniref:SGNH/GDSL hydrolase family protein n=1 Tax=Comamonas sp. lk TaxID=2201272 RepID=UPI0013CECD14|nr:SGNH/GDSL hydrolase family protein [Comamonas sp. lk]